MIQVLNRVKPKKLDRVIRCLFGRQVSEHLAHHTAEFIAVAAETSGKRDIRMIRKFIYNEMLVRAVGIEAGAGVE